MSELRLTMSKALFNYQDQYHIKQRLLDEYDEGNAFKVWYIDCLDGDMKSSIVIRHFNWKNHLCKTSLSWSVLITASVLKRHVSLTSTFYYRYNH